MFAFFSTNTCFFRAVLFEKQHNCICCCMNFQIFKICTRWEGGYAYHCSVVGVTLLPIVLHFSFLLLFLFSFLLSFLFSSFLFSLFASPASPCFSRHAFLPSASFPCFSRATSRNRRTTAMRFALRTMVQQGATVCKLLKETACPTTWLETNFQRYADLQVESQAFRNSSCVDSAIWRHAYEDNSFQKASLGRKFWKVFGVFCWASLMAQP